MDLKDCRTLTQLNAKAFADGISDTKQESSHHPLNNLSTCLRREFIYWAVIAYKTTYPDRSFIEFTADIAFTEALIKLRDDALGKKITDKGATIRTLVFTYFKFKLLELLQQETRRYKKEDDFKKQATLTVDDSAASQPVESQLEYQVLLKAIGQLKQEDQQIILRRHLLQEKPEQIAATLRMTTLSVNNKLYRAMKRLKAAINKLPHHGTDH